MSHNLLTLFVQSIQLAHKRELTKAKKKCLAIQIERGLKEAQKILDRLNQEIGRTPIK